MKLQNDILLKNYSTFKIGGPARYFCDCENVDELKEALSWAKKNKKEFFILGGGSNVLFSDKGFDGVVIRIKNSKLEIKNTLENPLNPPLKKGEEKRRVEGSKKIICGAGMNLGKLINFSIENSLTGLEWAVGIPGTVGGAVRGNAGAFGREMSDSIKLVKAIVLDEKDANKISNSQFIISNSKFQIHKNPSNPTFKKGERKEKFFEKISLDNKGCRFDYRSSIFKRGRYLIVWEVMLELKKGNKDESDKIIKEILSKRKEKQPFQYSSAGSVFKNPIASDDLIKSFEVEKNVKSKDGKVPAGWLIERCGLKGKKIGGSMVSEKNSNFIINTGNATADDVVILISLIKQKVRNNLGVQLQEEIEIIV